MAPRCVGQFLLVPAMALVAACSDAAAPEPALVELVSGNWQRAPLGQELAGPLVVRVMGLDSLPRRNVAVEWSVVEGAGLITPESSVTDEEGLAKARWTLGPSEWLQAAAALVRGEEVTFNGLGTPDDWNEVIEVVPSVTLEDGLLLAHVVIENHWASRLYFNAYGTCIVKANLYTETGELASDLGQANYVCHPGSIGVPEDFYLYQGDWWTSADALEPGEYTVRFTFNPGLQINGRTTVIPDIERSVVIG